MNNYNTATDLAGEVCFSPTFFQTKTRINYLINQYLSLEKLSSHLEDLTNQFINPQPRPWQQIDWQKINHEQLIGIDIDVFLAIIKGALDTEAPIRGYTQTSRQYLAPIHSQMAQFVGGIVAEDGTILELGLWEKEERQHTPALSKIYQQLTTQKITPTFRTPKSYQASDDSYRDLYHHGFYRVITEYSAVCLYLWMMVHTTGTIQEVLGEILQDEINHMTKFWGFGVWLASDFNLWQIVSLQLNNKHNRHQNQSATNIVSTFRRMMRVLHWESWKPIHKIELIYIFTRIFQLMYRWNTNLSPEYLHKLLADSYFSENNTVDY